MKNGTMAYTSTQLEALESAIAAGILRVEINGKTVQYQSLSAMRALRDAMRAELGVTPPANARGKAWQPVTGTGL